MACLQISPQWPWMALRARRLLARMASLQISPQWPWMALRA
jgi:hypothetical protein